MTIEEQCRLSYYKKIAEISTHKNVSLVQHVENKKIYVRKEQVVYNKEIYEYLQKSNNPHVPRIYELVEDKKTLILIEEYIQGDSLQEIVHRQGSLLRNLGIQYMITLCDVLVELHALPAPVIHRDLKPENIIIQEGGYLRIIDFNTAKKYDASRESDTVIIGTQKYAAPEQYGFQQSDARTDIFSIGVMLNYILTGKYPSEMVYNDDKHVNRIITKCTAFDPEKRYQTVSDLRNDLQKALKGEKVQEVDVREKTSQDVYADDTVVTWEPPGFRSKTPWKIVLGCLGYLFLTVCCFTMDITNSDGSTAVGVELWLNRMAAFVCCIFTVLYWFDYRGIQKYAPLTDKRWGKILMDMIVPFLFAVVVVLILDFIV